MLSFSQIIWLLGGWSVVLLAIVKFAGDNVILKLKIKWEQQSKQQIDILKGEIDRKNQLVSQILNTHSSTFQSTNTKKGEFFQTFWDIIVQIRTLNRSTETVYSFITEKEIEGLYTSNDIGHKNIRDSFLAVISQEYGNAANEADRLRVLVDKSRPFIGERLYNLFYLYSTFCMRATYLLIKDAHRRICTVWTKDTALLTSLKDALTETEIEFVTSRNFDSFRLTVSILESKMISQISYSLTGQEAVDNSISQAEKIEKLMKLNSK